MKAYFDTSAFGALIFDDAGAQPLREWIVTFAIGGTISDFGWGELHSAIGLRVRLKVFTPSRATEIVVAAPVTLAHWDRVLIETRDIADAIDMLRDFNLNLRLPDAIHLAVARRLGIVLVSTDHQQVRAARTLGIAAINPLELE